MPIINDETREPKEPEKPKIDPLQKELDDLILKKEIAQEKVNIAQIEGKLKTTEDFEKMEKENITLSSRLKQSEQKNKEEEDELKSLRELKITIQKREKDLTIIMNNLRESLEFIKLVKKHRDIVMQCIAILNDPRRNTMWNDTTSTHLADMLGSLISPRTNDLGELTDVYKRAMAAYEAEQSYSN